jgi:hypothetical protein
MNADRNNTRVVRRVTEQIITEILKISVIEYHILTQEKLHNI